MLALLWLTQDGQIFFPQPVRGATHPPKGWKLERIAIPAADGTTLAGVLVLPATPPPAQAARHAVLYFGGNAEEVTASAISAAETYGDRPVLLVNYRGYGESGGRPGEKAMVSDALELFDWASKRPDVAGNGLCAHGRSLGTGVALQLAASRPVACLVLSSPFDSLVALARTHLPWVPAGLLLRHRFDSLGLAPGLRVPTLVLYGGKDTVVPASHSERLAAALGGRVDTLRLDAAGHNDLEADPRYAAAIRRFLDAPLDPSQGARTLP